MPKILVFTKNSGKVPTCPKRPGLEFEHIQFETNDIDHLLIIARYRIINFPTSLIIDNQGKVLLKVKGSIPAAYMNKVLG